jgi:hypothetical protein
LDLQASLPDPENLGLDALLSIKEPVCLAELQEMAVGRHVAVMFFQTAGEAMVAIPIRHKVKELGTRGVHGRLQSATARIRNRTGWQSGQAIGVIRRRNCEVWMM